jgi:uncharacterized membrane protein
MENNTRTWHDKHKDSLTTGQRIADKVAAYMGSWRFIIIQSIFVTAWIVFNLIAYFEHWDPYPFILMNLIFSTQAAYAAPIIMMAQNRQSDRDRQQAIKDYETDIKSQKEIEELKNALKRIESEKLDKILNILNSK